MPVEYDNLSMHLQSMMSSQLYQWISTTNTQDVFVFNSFKGVWFDWHRMTSELTITTSAKHLNAEIIQWSSQVKNQDQELIGYVNMGLNVLTN